ncbi:MAG: TRAP transporter substrate-binding protein DctP [Desulforhopalus sp.]
MNQVKNPSRRNFMKLTGAVCGGLAIAGIGGILPRFSQAEQTYTGVTYYTPSYKGIFEIKRQFIAQLKKNAGEKFKVNFYDSGTLMKADEQTSALRSQSIQFMFHTTSYVTRSFKILGITGLPSLVQQLYVHGDRMAMESPLWKLMNDSLAKDNIFMLSAGGGVLEPEYIWSGDKRIASLSDLKGKRLRVVSYEATEALKEYGVAGVRVPSSETYLALQRGTVDGAVLNINTTIGRRLFEQVKYCYQLPVTAFTVGLFMLKSTWEKLDDPTKAAFWEAAKWYDSNFCYQINNQYDIEQYWPQIKDAGIEIIQPSTEELENFQVKSKPIWDWWKKEVGESVGQKAIDLAMGLK